MLNHHPYIGVLHEDAILEPATLLQLISLIDLTNLDEQASEQQIAALCEHAQTPHGPVAAVCINPAFVPLAIKKLHKTPIKIATVANFPSGAYPLQEIEKTIKTACDTGAHEIDAVFPYSLYLSGESTAALHQVEHFKRWCGDRTLKLILEISAFGDLAVLEVLSGEVLSAGADFIKTSTGKSAHGATIPASRVMLAALKTIQPHYLTRTFGFKASGGIRTPQQAWQYVLLAESILGKEWITPAHFRMGASSLLAEILAVLR